MPKQDITEEMGIQKEWYEQAGEMDLSRLPAFIAHLMNDYSHDYGTICHALAAGAIATMYAMNKDEQQGGITGFQASCIMWEIIRAWSYRSNECGLRIIDYDKFLYPQYKDNFQKAISSKTWAAIQEKSQKLLNEADKNYVDYLECKKKYDEEIAAFVQKYPDYYERQDFYDHLSSGTGEEWEQYYNKKAGGFEFAPIKPYPPVNAVSPVYQHWQSIIQGIIPFGYRVDNEM